MVAVGVVGTVRVVVRVDEDAVAVGEALPAVLAAETSSCEQEEQSGNEGCDGRFPPVRAASGAFDLRCSEGLADHPGARVVGVKRVGAELVDFLAVADPVPVAGLGSRRFGFLGGGCGGGQRLSCLRRFGGFRFRRGFRFEDVLSFAGGAVLDCACV